MKPARLEFGLAFSCADRQGAPMATGKEPAKIEPAEVRHIAELARLKLTDDEVELMGAQLSSILHYVKRLSALSTDDVDPTAHAVPLVNVYRDDRVAPSMDSGIALANAPQRQDGFFQVPKVLGEESA